MSRKKKIAVLLIGVSDIEGGGGAERFWADVSQMFESEKISISFFVDRSTHKSLKAVNRLTEESNVVHIPDSPKNKIGLIFYLLRVYFILLRHNIKILHIGFYGAHYYKLLRFLSILPKSIRPKISITIVSCFTPYCFIDETYERKYKMKYRYDDLFNNVKLDGILSWYKKFKEVSESNEIVKSKPYIYPVKYCFTDLTRYEGSRIKSKTIVFAARITGIKRPMLFIELVKKVKELKPEIFNEWEFQLYGDGDLMSKVQQNVKECNLNNEVQFKKASDLSKVLNQTKVFVSTQELENFTSLSMLEAMACENVIISFDVGQTDYFVKNKENGYLVEDENIGAMALAIIDYIGLDQDTQREMEIKSRAIAIEEHNKENFNLELEEYFIKIL
jgi:glycosyltransferase involved in cell wall biosynthesis